MVTKAIVEEVLDNYTIRVRIPFYNQIKSVSTSTPTKDLNIATICSLPNSQMNLQLNDIVYVAFEDNQIDQPVIIGQLSRTTKSDQNPTIIADTLTTKVDAYLPKYTYIGDVGPDEWQYLKGLNSNLQYQLEILSKRIAKLEDEITKLKKE